MKKLILNYTVFLLVIILSVCFASCSMPSLNNAGETTGTNPPAEIFNYENFKYSVENNQVTIEGYVGSNAEELVIPSSINGMEVVALGDMCLHGHNELKSVVIPYTVKHIGSGVFSRCHGLTEVNIPETVEYIDDCAFFKCVLLENIFVDDENPNYCDVDGVLYNKNVTKLIYYPDYASRAVYVTPDSVTEIGYGAFGNGERPLLCELIFGESVITFPSYNVFVDCDMDITPRILVCQNSKAEAYFNEYSLPCEYIPEDFDISADEAKFAEYKYVIKDGEVTLVRYRGEGKADLVVPSEIEGKSVTVIGDDCFIDNREIKSIVLPDTVKTIEFRAMIGCSSLESISIPSSVTSIGVDAFEDCYSLKGVYVDKNNKNYSDIDGVLYDKDIEEIIYFPIGKEGGEYVFPDTVSKFPDYNLFIDYRSDYSKMPVIYVRRGSMAEAYMNQYATPYSYLP